MNTGSTFQEAWINFLHEENISENMHEIKIRCFCFVFLFYFFFNLSKYYFSDQSLIAVSKKINAVYSFEGTVLENVASTCIINTCALV